MTRISFPAMCRISSRIPAGVSRSMANVLKSRELTPHTRLSVPAFSAISASLRKSSSRRSSSNADIPSVRHFFTISRSISSSRMRAIRRTTSAPHLYATSISSGQRIKSFLRTQGAIFPVRTAYESTERHTAIKSFKSPLKYRFSVSTEIAAAPASAYVSAVFAASSPGAISPLLGEARFTSSTAPFFKRNGVIPRKRFSGTATPNV